MKTKIITLIAIVISLTSCSTRLYPINEKYKPTDNGVFVTNMPQKEVISKLVAFLTENGNSIALIDRESGIITTTEISFLGKDTQVDKSGNLVDCDAYVVSGVPQKSLANTNMFGDRIDPYEITGFWSIHLTTQGSETEVSIKATNLKCKYRKVLVGMASNTYVDVPVKSTGVFETKMIDFLRK